MSFSSHATPSPRDLLAVCRRYPRRFFVPVVVVMLIAAAYAVVRSDTWKATQALFVRNEAASTEGNNPGKFRQPEDMKITQETVMEIVKSPSVLAGALKEVGPANGKVKNGFPTAKDVEDLRKEIKLSPPHGAEFGTTEVFYLEVKDSDRARAIALAGAICGQLESHFQKLRDLKAQSVINELTRSIAISEAELDESTAELRALESQAGSDLAELRILHRAASDTSDLRRNMVDIEGQLRQARLKLESDDQLLALLHEAKEHPETLLATPNDLLVSQPALRQLKDSLVSATIKTAELKGKMSDEHPLVREAKGSEKEIADQLTRELDSAIRGLTVERKMTAARVETLNKHLAETKGRLERIAAGRADYSRLVDKVEHQTRLIEQSRRDLSDARASQAGAATVSLIGRIDAATTGSKPVGPSRALILLAGLVGGFVAGAGVLFVTVPPHELTGAVKPIGNGRLTGVAIANEPAAKGEPKRGITITQALSKIAQSSSVN